MPAKVDIASELRYREPVLDPDGLFLVISPSGKTADTPKCDHAGDQAGNNRDSTFNLWQEPVKAVELPFFSPARLSWLSGFDAT